MLVLLSVLILTAILFGATGLSDKILRAIVNEEVRAYRAQIAQQNPGLAEEELNELVENFKRNLEIEFGLDKPWYVRLPDMVRRIVVLDLGTSKHMTSFTGSNQIKDIILERIPYTVLLVTTAIIIVFIIGLGLGTWLSTKVGTLWDRGLSFFASVSYATPTWWLGLFLILVFAFYLQVLPYGGLLSPNPPKEFFPRLMDMLYHTILPVTTLVLALAGSAVYIYRSILVSTATEDFVTVARAKGLPENLVLRRYIIRPSLHPILTNLVLGLAGSLTGAILTETVFNWPGMGRLYYEAILNIDEPLILALTYVFTLIYVVARFILEILYIVVDPRVSVE
jgi:peptide/nickel transport system permease protein